MISLITISLLGICFLITFPNMPIFGYFHTLNDLEFHSTSLLNLFGDSYYSWFIKFSYIIYYFLLLLSIIIVTSLIFIKKKYKYFFLISLSIMNIILILFIFIKIFSIIIFLIGIYTIIISINIYDYYLNFGA